MKKSILETIVTIYLFSLLLGVLILLPTVGVSGAWNKITGWVSSINTTVVVNINNPPQISVSATTTTLSITEDGQATANFTFIVTDLDGIAQIDNATVFLRVNLTNETDRANNTCAGNGTIGATTYSFKCQVVIWYWDGAGNWTINASARDTIGAYGENITQTFELYSTTAMTMYPTNLTWTPLNLGATNQTSNSDPIVINNTGNKDIATGSISVTGYNLQGIMTKTDFINAQNFTVSPKNGTPGCTGNNCFECNGTMMLNATSTPIIAANLSAGNHSRSNLFNETGAPEEALFFCLRTVPSLTDISRQTYATNGTHTGAWAIAII